MRGSGPLLVMVLVGVGVLLTATPVRTQESQGASLFLLSPDNQLFSLEGVLNTPTSLASLGPSVWFHELSPLELALLPKGAWISATNRGGPANVFGGDPRSRFPWLVGSEGSKNEWGPLSEEALDAWEQELTSKALECSAELADSLRASYLSQGIEWTKETFSSYQDRLAKRYRLHFKVSDKQAAFHYDLKY